MKVLICGAGVIGSIFASKLQSSGNDVTILARGNRYKEIINQGVVIQDAKTKAPLITKVKVIKELSPEDYYDYIMIVMQKTQVNSILHVLKKTVHQI
jgi:2-dehydropantoate 2-reductase